MSKWKKIRLCDVINDIAAGPFGSNLPKSCFTESGFPIIDGANLKEIRVTDNITKFVTEEKARTLGRAIAKRGDVIVTISGTVGQISFIPESSKYSEYLVSQRQFRCTFNTKLVDVPYIVYYFHSYEGRNKILQFANQVGVPALSQPLKNFRNIQLELPPLAEQKKIAGILSALDEKIETNRKINARLEQLAQAIFKSRFIDFEPFGGQMPQDWVFKSISQFPHEIETGKRPKGGVAGFTDGIPSIGAESIKGIGYYDYSKTKYIPHEYAETLKKGRIKDFDLLIYKDGGKPGYFIPDFSMMGLGFPFNNMFLNEHVFRLNFGKPELNIFAYFFFKTDEVMNYLNSVGGKAAIPGINQKNVEDIEILDLTVSHVQKFGEIVLPIFKTILENCKESARLAELRDTLLPKLMSGELKPE